MPEIEIRPVEQDDVLPLTSIEHSFYSEYVWQMAINSESQSAAAEFTRVHLPRKVFVPYPRQRELIFSEQKATDYLLLARYVGQQVGYIKISLQTDCKVARVTDIAVLTNLRRQGIASGLLLAAMNLAKNRQMLYLDLEIQSRNDPAIMMANKLGFSFSGFQDHYFPNQDLAIFFSRFVR